MSNASSDRDFAERYAVLELDDGGVLLDLERGTYSALNGSAAAVCAALAGGGDSAVVIDRVARRLEIGVEVAAGAISDVRRGLDGVSPPPSVDVGPFRYERSPATGGYTLSFADEVRLEIAEDGSWLRISSAPVTAGQLYEYLRAVAPKVLFLRGAVVLHGSACRTGSGLRAICGASGAGKTTAGRAFAKAGLAPVSEDLLVLASVSPPRVYLDGERAVHAWAREMARVVSEGGSRTIDAKSLDAALSGEATPLDEIWLIEAGARYDGQRAELRPLRLSRVAAAIRLMGAVFLGASAPSSWRRFLEIVATLTGAIPFFDVAMPNGLARLESAARAYTENSAS